jgi:cytochrome P450
LRWHPQLLRLVDEADAGGSELRQATNFIVQRTRSIIEASLRRAKKRIRLGDWALPEGTHVMVNSHLAHESEENFPDAGSFVPDLFLGSSAFANMEMDVALRKRLRDRRERSAELS